MSDYQRFVSRGTIVVLVAGLTLVLIFALGGFASGLALLPRSPDDELYSILEDPRSTASDPAFAPDGASVVAVAWVDEGRMILRRVETATGEITDLVTGDWITGPDVSPDGAQVVFAVDPDFHADLAWGGSNDQSDLSAITSALYLVDTRGGSATRLTGPGDGGTHAAWSPDGRQIAYTCQIGESGGDLCLIDVDGGRVTPLIATPDLPEGKPTWSPDGRRIAFHSNQGSGWGIYAIDVGSKKIEQLFDVRDGLEIADPAWSPDGASIATAAGELSEDGGVCIRPLVGEASCFAGGPSGDWAPDWALDGQLVFNGYAFDVEYHLILILDPATGTTRWLVPGLGMRDAPTP